MNDLSQYTLVAQELRSPALKSNRHILRKSQVEESKGRAMSEFEDVGIGT